jgi:intracellular septation protein A
MENQSLLQRIAGHGLFRAGLFFASDLLSTLVFVAVFAISGNIYLATAVGIGLGVVRIVVAKLRGPAIDLMQWMSLGLVAVFGTATLITRDPRFIMVKPTLIYLVVAAVMLRPGWMNRYMPPVVVLNAADIPFAFGYVWAGLMALTAIANLAVAMAFGPKIWAAFIAVIPLASKLCLFGVQYAATRFLVRRRRRADAVQPA